MKLTLLTDDLDWFPSLCGLTGAPLPKSDIDGEDVSPAWLGRNTHVRTKPRLWKTSTMDRDAGIREGRWKLIHRTIQRGGDELYDIPADPAKARMAACSSSRDITRRACRQWAGKSAP